MTTTALFEAISVALAYLIGSIPFGYLIARAVAGVDIRTVGSGNIGATNVGRTLGFRFFLLVFVLDAAKGFAPTLLFPSLVEHGVGHPVPNLAPLAAIAAVLGHNFPVYLRFKGGKGVATTLGAVTALDPVASLAAVFGFAIFLVLTRFVSLASILGGLVFVGAHFAATPEPFGRDHVLLSLLTIALMALIVVRHRKNLARLSSGTEPKIKFRKTKRPTGRVRAILIPAILAAGLASGLALHAARRGELEVLGRRVVEVGRMATGHQRAERLVFLDGGRRLVVTCPRYLRVVLAKVGETPSGEPGAVDILRDIQLEGRPVAIAAAPSGDRFYVLQRPHGDARHLEEAWWEAFDLEGRPIGSRARIGWDPDDFALTPDGRIAYVLTSGSAEGESNRPLPALIAFELTESGPRAIGRATFDRPGEDPERLLFQPNGQGAAVSLRGSNQVARLDLSDPTRPRIVDRLDVPSPGLPETLSIAPDGRLIVGDPDASSLWRVEGDRFVAVSVEGGVGDLIGANGLVFATLPRASGLAVLGGDARDSIGTLPIRGAARLATTRPLGLAYSPDRGLLAVSNRAGGSVHLFKVSPTSLENRASEAVVARLGSGAEPE